MSEDMLRETNIGYRLAQTRVLISGSAETEAHRGGRLIVAANASVQLVTAADPHEWVTLGMPEKAAADRAFTLTLTEDGRVISTDATAVGRVGSLLQSVVSTVSTVAGVALGVLGRGGLAVAALGEEGVRAQTWEGEHPELAELRTRLVAVRTKARTLVAQLADEALDHTDSGARRAALARAADVRRVISDVGRELAAIETQRAEWISAQAERRSEHHSFILDIDDLPTEDAVAKWRPDEVAPDMIGKAFSPLVALGVVVTHRDVTPRVQSIEPKVDGTRYEGVWYRRPRRVELRVYRVVGVNRIEHVEPSHGKPGDEVPASGGGGTAPDPLAVADALDREPLTPARPEGSVYVPVMTGNGPVPWLTLIEQREVEVVDKHCSYGWIPFRSAWFGERSASITLGPLGSPVAMGSSRTSALRELAEAVADLPQQALSGLETANKIVDQGEVAMRQTAERRLADLKRHQALLEQQLLLTDTQATASIRSELAVVKAEQELITGTRDLEAVRRDLDVQRRSTEARASAQIDELSNAIVREKVERLELAGKIRELEAQAVTAPLELAERLAELQTEIARLELVADRIAAGELPPSSTTDSP